MSQSSQIEEIVERVKKQGHGEIIIKIRNGYVYRILETYDALVKERKVDK